MWVAVMAGVVVLGEEEPARVADRVAFRRHFASGLFSENICDGYITNRL